MVWARAARTNNTAVQVFLVGSFVASNLRSWIQDRRETEAVEALKEVMIETNKVMGDLKQQLYAEANSTRTALVPLSELNAVFADATPPSDPVTF